jgi:hypothetical protein
MPCSPSPASSGCDSADRLWRTVRGLPGPCRRDASPAAPPKPREVPQVPQVRRAPAGPLIQTVQSAASRCCPVISLNQGRPLSAVLLLCRGHPVNGSAQRCQQLRAEI